jgi:hypothetical protein
MKKYEVLDKDDGYWIVDNEGYSQGPYSTIKDAEDNVPNEAYLQYPLFKLN